MSKGDEHLLPFTFFLYDELGEGVSRIMFKGKMTQIHTWRGKDHCEKFDYLKCFSERIPWGHSDKKVGSYGNRDWWLKIKLPNGKFGWALDGESKVKGSSSCS